MPLHKYGSRGDEVEQIQYRLQELGYYHDSVDGIYGSGTENAVRDFQKVAGLEDDGIVGPATWAHLFEEETSSPTAILNEPLAYRTLALTGSFETGLPPPGCFASISGNFDGQGISYGALQWNLGQNTLQPMLKTMSEQHNEELRNIFGEHFLNFCEMLDKPQSEQLKWARSVQDRNVLNEPWLSYFTQLGSCESFQKLEVEAARQFYEEAVEMATKFGLASERAIALMFDIRVQNGSISAFTEKQIRKDFKALPEAEDEVARLCIIANRRAEASNPQWIEDVRTRKLTVATGRGSVHGIHYVLDEEYGIGLEEAL